MIGVTRRVAVALTAAILVCGAVAIARSEPLKPVSDFDRIGDRKARSVALFEEAAKVLMHPRCVNCHPAGNSPLQGKTQRLHEPPVTRGADGFGAAGMRCNTCHGVRNVELMVEAGALKSIPGHEKWHLAPLEMAWEKKSARDICEQIKDTKRNGGMDMAALVEHMAHDSLVGWGWDPGLGREPAPGSQKEFGALIEAWARTGAACPPG